MHNLNKNRKWKYRFYSWPIKNISDKLSCTFNLSGLFVDIYKHDCENTRQIDIVLNLRFQKLHYFLSNTITKQAYRIKFTINYYCPETDKKTMPYLKY